MTATTGALSAVRSADDDDGRGKPRVSYLIVLGLLVLSIAAIWGATSAILLPLHVQQIEFARYFTGADAQVDLATLNALKAQVSTGLAVSSEQGRLLDLLARFDAARAQSLSIVTVVGVVAALVIQPIVGIFSDRTRSRAGRRAPWILAGGAISVLGLVGMSLSHSLPLLILFYGLTGAGTNLASSPLFATIADRVSAKHVGGASAMAGLGGMIGLVGGIAIGGVLFPDLGASAYLPFATVIVFAILFVAVAPDRSSRDMAVDTASVGSHLKSLTVALGDSDFRWAWMSKMLIMFGYSVGATFTIYMLQSYIRDGLSASEASETAPLLHIAALPAMLVAMAISGKWSDKLGRRKPFVVTSALLLAASMAVPLFWPTLPALFIQAILAGLALGSFLVVDQALFIDVLPDSKAAGRDLGMSALGGNLGQSLGPIVGGLIVSVTGGYQMLWLVSLLLVLVSAATILPIKRAR